MSKELKLICSHCKKALTPNDSKLVKEVPLAKKDAKALGMIPLSIPIPKSEFGYLEHMIEDCIRIKRNYAIVKEPKNELSIWVATNSLVSKDKDT